MKHPTLYCSFCGKSQYEVICLISGPTAFICEECVDICTEIVAEKRGQLYGAIAYERVMSSALGEEVILCAQMTKRQNPCAHLSNDADLVQDHNDCMSTPPWHERTKENQQKCLKLFRQLRQRINVVIMIKINLKGGSDIMYPIEFQSLKDAHDWLTLSPDPLLRPPGLKSWSYETVRKPLPDGFK